MRRLRRLSSSYGRALVLLVVCVLAVFATTTVKAKIAKADTKDIELFTIGDSWTAYPGQSGAAQGACTVPYFSVQFYGLPVGSCPSGNYGVPAVGSPLNLAGGLSPNGILIDRLNAQGIDASHGFTINHHSFAVGGTLASQWVVGIPNDLSPSEATGQWLPIEQQLANVNPNSGQDPIVYMTLGGNDIWPQGINYPINDNADWTNFFNNTLQPELEKVIHFLININPHVEIIVPSYTNFKIDDVVPSNYPPVGGYGFCREFWGANTNGSGFYATTWQTYNAAVVTLATQKANADVANLATTYYNANVWRTQLSPFFSNYITVANLHIEANNYAQAQFSNYYGTEIGTLSPVWSDPSVISASWGSINEQAINGLITHRLDPIWKSLQANPNYANNLIYVPSWTTLSNEGSQPINANASPPRSEYSDCLHLNSDGFSKYIDYIISQWRPQSRYLSTPRK